MATIQCSECGEVFGSENAQENYENHDCEDRTKPMFSYDSEAGAGYIKLADGDVDETVPCSNGVNLDFNKDGELLGVEIYNTGTIPSKLIG